MFLEEAPIREKRFAIHAQNGLAVQHDRFQIEFKCMTIKEDNRASFQTVIAALSKHPLEECLPGCMKCACVNTKFTTGGILKIQNNIAIRGTGSEERMIAARTVYRLLHLSHLSQETFASQRGRMSIALRADCNQVWCYK